MWKIDIRMLTKWLRYVRRSTYWILLIMTGPSRPITFNVSLTGGRL
jgi:hypothetical protein